MERSEPSLIPEWLKGGGLPGTHVSQPGLYQDDGGSPFLPRHRASQELPVVGGGHVDYDSPRASVSSAGPFIPSTRRGPGSGASSSSGADRESFTQGRAYSGFTRSSSIRGYDTPERDGFRSDWEREVDRDFWSRERERSLGFGTDERERDRERLDNGMLRLSIPGTSGKYDTDVKLRRSQSMGLSNRIPDNGLRKMIETVNIPSAVPSVSGGLATSMQKAVFERNFPSLGADEKQGVRPMSPGNACIASPRPLRQSSSRSDLGRATSPGLTGGFGGSISTTTSSVSGGADLWSSALAEVPSSNGSVQGNGLSVNVLSVSTAGLISSFPGPISAAPVNALNMAEALTQNPLRVRTPPQLSIESQRLEELALKQSRQLIPMTPTLPKAMSLADKGKSKQLRTVDGLVTTSFKGNQLSSSLQLNSPHRSTPAKPDTPKVSQGKLLVLKSGKDGITTVSSTPKSEGRNASPVASHGNVGLTASAISASVAAPGVIGQRKSSVDRRAAVLPGAAGLDALAGLRAKDFSHIGEDRRLSVQAQNRSDFFNALRKKAAGNGGVPFNSNKSDSLRQPKTDVMSIREALIPEETEETVTNVGHGSVAKENSVDQGHSIRFLSEIHSNGDVKHSPGDNLILDEVGSLVKESSGVNSLEGANGGVLPGDSEEEEAAFMRSLGWEENAEGSELTQEEINAFYQMRERNKVLNSRNCHRLRDLRVEHSVGSLGSASSGLSSSDSESDDEVHV